MRRNSILYVPKFPLQNDFADELLAKLLFAGDALGGDHVCGGGAIVIHMTWQYPLIYVVAPHAWRYNMDVKAR